MFTQLSLETIGGVLDGTLSNPASYLGPHEIEHEGRKAFSVRAFLPQSQRVWILDEKSGAQRPMRRIHPSGIFEGILPADSITSSHIRKLATIVILKRQVIDYELQTKTGIFKTCTTPMPFPVC